MSQIHNFCPFSFEYNTNKILQVILLCLRMPLPNQLAKTNTISVLQILNVATRRTGQVKNWDVWPNVTREDAWSTSNVCSILEFRKMRLRSRSLTKSWRWISQQSLIKTIYFAASQSIRNEQENKVRLLIQKNISTHSRIHWFIIKLCCF